MSAAVIWPCHATLDDRNMCNAQSCSPAQTMTTPASEASQGSPQRRMHSPGTPFLDVSCCHSKSLCSQKSSDYV